MVTRKTFDFWILMFALAVPAKGLVTMAARRWSREESGVLRTVGDAALVAQL